MATTHNAVRYVICFVASALTLLLISVGLSWFFHPIAGDLTRIGNWAERDFGPGEATAPVPVIAHVATPSQVQPGLLVLGDSFTHPNIWQSYFSQSSGLPTYSYQFKDVRCIDNWLNWLVSSEGSGSRTVVMQVAERSFIAVFRNERICAPERIRVSTELSNVSSPRDATRRLDLDATYLFRTTVNTARMKFQSGRLVSGGVINVPLSSSALFSNKVSNRLLYYAEDDNKNLWRKSDVDASIKNLHAIKNRLAAVNIRFVVVVVPDKSTVYRQYIRDLNVAGPYPDLSASISSAGIDTVDLRSLFARNVQKVVDLYLPNDTHLGESGYRLMGEAIAHAIQRKAPGGMP